MPAPLGCAHRLRMARRVLAGGGVIAYPTEAVYGLGCDPRNADAVRRLLRVKQRPERQGLILIGADFEMLRPSVEPLDAERMAPILATWPGPRTWLLPARPDTPRWLSGVHDTLAVRVTNHPLAAALCRAWGGALVSTSANRAGQPPARGALQTRQRLGAALDAIVVGPLGASARPTPIHDGRTGRVVRA